MSRLIQMLDFAMGRAAKGVLIIPEDCIPEGYDLDEIAKKWSSFNGVIKLKLKAGVPIPQQITANITNFEAMEMFNIQLQLAQQIFGVNPAIQGQAPSAGTPASRYAQETQNATLNSKDLFEMFAKYKQSKYLKIMKLIQQYYQTPMYIKVTGRIIKRMIRSLFLTGLEIWSLIWLSRRQVTVLHSKLWKMSSYLSLWKWGCWIWKVL